MREKPGGQTKSAAKSAAVDLDLQRIFEAWPKLPKPIKRLEWAKAALDRARR